MTFERAREVLAIQFSDGPALRNYVRANELLTALAVNGLIIIDTRTHVAVPHEDEDALVEAVARALLKARYYDCEPEMYASLDEFFEGNWQHMGGGDAMFEARAALAAVRAHAAKEG